MLRFLRAVPFFAGATLALATSCGGSDTPVAGAGAGKNFPTTPGTQGTSFDASGKKTGSSNSRSCAGGPGADTHCGGNGTDESALGSTDCCETRTIPGGSYNRFNDSAFPATVSAFKLDTFLVTAGRIRAWVDAMKGDLLSSAPPPGAGANPNVPNSGWRAEWNRFLPSTRADVDRMFGPEYDTEGFLACQFGTEFDDLGALTWFTSDLDTKLKDANQDNDNKEGVLKENTQDALDRKPINCIPWHVLLAFCIWDGGRLPTDAEFGFAAAGGAEQRKFPWGDLSGKDIAHIGGMDQLSSPPIFSVGKKFMAARLWDRTINDGENTFEDNYGLTWFTNQFDLMHPENAAHVMPVGRRPAGNGKWGQSDLAGGMFEWMLDEGPIKPGQCKDCANTNYPDVTELDPKATMTQPDFQNKTVDGVNWFRGGARSIRGGAWDNAIMLANSQSKDEIDYYTSYPVLRTYRALGGRCARNIDQ